MPTSILTITVATSVPPDSTNITIYISSGTTHVLIYNVLFSHIGLKTIQISDLTQIIDKERTDISGWCWSGVRESKYKYWTLGDCHHHQLHYLHSDRLLAIIYTTNTDETFFIRHTSYTVKSDSSCRHL